MKKYIIRNILLNILGGVLLAFGLYNIHSFSKVTEGGILGLTLLLDYWFSISPSISGFILNAICYIIGFKILGKKFIFYSFVAAGSFSLSYAIFEIFPPIYPSIGEYPFIASIIGAIFVGISVGICVKFGGAPTGDDALAMSLSYKLKKDIRWIYLFGDFLVLGLSLTYIEFTRIFYSLITVILSGQIIGWIQKIKLKEEKIKNNI